MDRLGIYADEFKLNESKVLGEGIAYVDVHDLICQIGAILGIGYNKMAEACSIYTYFDDDTMTVAINPIYEYQCEDAKTYEKYKLLIELLKMLCEEEETVK